MRVRNLHRYFLKDDNKQRKIKMNNTFKVI
jgi:hypothetical protein